MNNQIFSKKKIFSKSEKDNIKYVEANTKLNELNDILDTDDIKKFTHENRTYENIEQFINSKNKASELLYSVMYDFMPAMSLNQIDYSQDLSM
jgi:hypothetical protein